METVVQEEAHVVVDLAGDNGLKAQDSSIRKSSLHAVGVQFAWKDVNVQVPVKTGGILGIGQKDTGEKKSILNKVSGFVDPGEILYIMGPSGAGKSTMLDALADRVAVDVEGYQALNRLKKTPNGLKSIAKYVEQTDDMFGSLTVKETLDVAAGLYVKEKAKRESIVEEVIQMLGLTAQRDVKIGSPFFRGLSGGQRRRVSIGIELVGSPQLLFLDEPTSGLDSAASYYVMKELQNLVRTTNMTLIITIHQPSELVFEMADKLLLLSGGQTCYFGDAHKAGDYFTKSGFSCPPRMSQIEWMVDLINQDFGDTQTVWKCRDNWANSEEAKTCDRDVMERGCQTKEEAAAEQVGGMKRIAKGLDSDNKMEYAVGFFQQCMVLVRRGVLNTVKNPVVIWLRFAMYFMLAVLIGTVWLRLGSSSVVIPDINGCLFYVCAFMVFMSSSVLPAYLEERSVMVRERANGAYSVFAYILAHTVYEIPYVFLLSLMASSITYWLVGLTPSASRFFIYVANLFMALFVAESIMVFISAVIPILIIGIAAGSFLFGAFMCVMGYFINVETIGWWWRWMQYIALHYYAFSTFITNQYRNTTWKAFPNPGGFPDYPTDVDGNDIVTSLAVESRIWLNFVALLIMVFVYRFLAACYMHFFIKGKK
eukprot:CAMPEP_0182445364 /NCGR_PEP_ID=MMETSP1172-20130603/3509_1 /TAXON_ID=708627 /ORGANISM="Timspurckia oligopyrenoides, Strain CCMP3278" /LENGTH=650 /DNA_ID=CAMNT_0024641125 /DNA_START=139 /DNA_END=2091 /DNA_ORIENTATION=+